MTAADPTGSLTGEFHPGDINEGPPPQHIPGTRVQAILLDEDRAELPGMIGTVVPIADWPIAFPEQWTDENTVIIRWDGDGVRFTPYSLDVAARTLIVLDDDADGDEYPPEPPLGDQILADMRLSDSEAFAAAGIAYVTPTNPPTGAVTAPTPAPVGDTTDADWDALAALEGPDCPACEDDPDEPHVDDCRWIARQRANRPILLTLDGVRMRRHASDPDLDDLYVMGWTEVPLDQIPSLVELDQREAAAEMQSARDHLVARALKWEVARGMSVEVFSVAADELADAVRAYLAAVSS